MECPHCHQEIPGRECPRCGTAVPMESHFCMECGVRFEIHTEEIDEGDDDFDLENRVLCSDGTCTGIILEGKCTECNSPYKGPG